MSVTDLIQFGNKGETLSKKLFLALVIILVALLAFGIGRLTTRAPEEGIKIEYDPSLSAFKASETRKSTSQSATVLKSLETSSGGVIASQNGTKYHYLHCPGAKQIREENKISFGSAKEAEASGYTLAGNCKPR